MNLKNSELVKEILEDYFKETGSMRTREDISPFESWLLKRYLNKKDAEKYTFQKLKSVEILNQMKKESNRKPFEEKGITIAVMDDSVNEWINLIFGKDAVDSLRFAEGRENKKESYEDYGLILTLKRHDEFTL